MTTVIGLDISLTGTGIARNDGWCSVVGKTGVTTLDLPGRVGQLQWLMVQIVNAVPSGCALVAMEQPAFSRAYGGAVERHALWYLVASFLMERGIPVAEVPATTLKKFGCGKGNSTKAALVDALARRMPQFVTGGNDNLVDAAWLCAVAAERLGVPIVAMPAVNRAALDGVTWPAVA